jgi:hypothetical protein
MESRWLTTEEQRTRTVESGSLSEILALAQQLQTENEGLMTEAQVVEMGRELGIQPEYVRQALRRTRAVAEPETTREPPGEMRSLVVEEGPPDEGPLRAVGNTLLVLFGALMFPVAMEGLDRGDVVWVGPTALVVAAIAGWVARYPRLAAVAGALSAPVTLLAGIFYNMMAPHYGEPNPGLILGMLSLAPLGSGFGRGAARLRRWVERIGERQRRAAMGQ